MHNLGLRKERCILGKQYEEKITFFTSFKAYVNYLYCSVLSSNCIISYIAQTQHFRNLKFQKTKTEAPVVINLFFKKYIDLSISRIYFHQSDQLYQNICTTFMLSYLMEFFFRCLFLFVVLLLFCCSFCFFCLSFLFLAKILALTVKIKPLQHALFN